MKDFEKLEGRIWLFAVVLVLMLAVGCSRGGEVDENEPSPSISPTVAPTSEDHASEPDPVSEERVVSTPTAVVAVDKDSEAESGDDDSSDESSEVEVAKECYEIDGECEPSLVSVPEEQLSRLLEAGATIKSDRSKPVLYQKHFKSYDHSIRVAKASVHGLGESCGDKEPPVSYVCVSIDLEITNLSDHDEERVYEDIDFSVVGGSGTVYDEGPEGIGLQKYGSQGASVPRHQRLLTQVVRYVHAAEDDLMLVYKEDFETLRAFWLSDDVPYREVSAEPAALNQPPDEIGYVGSWVGNAVPFGDAHAVNGFELRILEFERGWTPGEGCCPGGVPETLLSIENSVFTGLTNATAASVLSEELMDVKPFDGTTQFVRVRFEATNPGNINRKSHFSAADFMLVDRERRVYESMLYTNAATFMRVPDRIYEWGHRTYDTFTRPTEIYGGGRIVGELAWLVPEDTPELTLVHFPYNSGRAGFLSLEELTDTSIVEPPADTSWIDDALGPNATWMTRPAPKGSGARHGEHVTVRVLDVETHPSPCVEFWAPTVGNECLRVELEIVLEKPGNLRRMFDIHNYEVTFVVDDEAINETLRLDENSHVPLSPEFDSPLDWAELNGRGTAKLSYSIEIQQGWREATLVYAAPNEWETNLAPVFLSLIEEDSAQAVDNENRADIAATMTAASSADGIGLFEFLSEAGNGVDDYDEDAWVALTGTAMACADYVARPSERTETLVMGAVLALSETSIGPVAASYFDGAENPAVFCEKAFPESSKSLVLTMLIGFSQYVCLLGGQGAFAFTPTSAMEFADILVGYWGDDAPVSMSEFDGPEDFCGWVFDEENEDILELLESADVSLLGSGG